LTSRFLHVDNSGATFEKRKRWRA